MFCVGVADVSQCCGRKSLQAQHCIEALLKESFKSPRQSPLNVLEESEDAGRSEERVMSVQRFCEGKEQESYPKPCYDRVDFVRFRHSCGAACGVLDLRVQAMMILAVDIF